MNVNRILRISLCMGIAVLSFQFSQGQVFGKLNYKSPIFADVSTNTMYALANDFRHRTKLDIINLYSGNYNVQVVCKWKDMYRAKDMGTDRTFLIRQNDVVQLDNNLSQINSRLYPQSTYAQRNASFSAAVPYCIDPGAAPLPTATVSRTNFVNQSMTRGGNLPTTTTTLVNSPPSGIHVVQPKENLYRIGLKYKIPYKEIMAVNGLATEEVYPGQRLRIERSTLSTARTYNTGNLEPLPVSTQPTTMLTRSSTAPSQVITYNTYSSPEIVGGMEYMSHLVLKGETLTSIAKNYDASLQEILAANPEITDRNNIKVNTIVLVPFRPF
ncbi:MAG: LysM peptidoglycan-binding domain-containing protein [Bacteroidota bacterium]